MKLFHTENNKEVVYVQMNDLMYLNSTDLPIPASIFTKVFTGIVIVNDSNRFNFVRFDEEHEIKFFKDLDFILDFDKFKDLSDEELEKEAQKLVLEANEIVDKWNSMTLSKRKKNSKLLQEHENLKYMLIFLSEIHAIKNNEKSMPFPDFIELAKN